MRTIRTLLLVLLAALVGLSFSPYNGLNGILAASVAYLLLEIFALRRRIGTLEEAATKMRSAQQPVQTAARTEIKGDPELSAPAAIVQKQARSPLPDVVEKMAHSAASPPQAARTDRHSMLGLFSPMFTIFTNGNPVLKIGIIVLFFGVAFLLNYAAQRDLIPIELRLIGVALGGLSLLVFGWLLRRKHSAYGLGLEGGGIGVLYLVVFAAAKLYHLLPLPLALTLMIGLVGLSCALAVLQESKGLAVAGSIGGFLAPVLMSTGSGDHVLLFSYYALLDSGILGIAWFKAWRELNLVGFLFTFGIATLWGASAYTPAHFSSTEPFLILFFLMYCLIAILFAHRQPLQLRGHIDGPLIFGLPIIASGLQAHLVHGFRYGMALSALALGFWYIGLAGLLWRRVAGGMRLLTEAFLALGVVFASLAIPLGLDPHWTTAAWALEGAAMVWVGVRQNRPTARLFGLLLQLGAAFPFLNHSFLPAESLLFANRIFFGISLIAAAALLSSFWLDHNRPQAKRWEQPLPNILLAWGLVWWYSGGYRDLEHHLDWHAQSPAFLLFACMTTACLGLLVRYFCWQRLTTGLLILLPIMLLTLVNQTVGWGGGPLLFGYGWLAWPLAFAFQYSMLALFEDKLPPQALPISHNLTLWLLLLATTVEGVWRVEQIPGLHETWSLACWGGIPAALLFSLELQGNRLTWPVDRFALIYHGVGTDLPLLGLLLWTGASFSMSGTPSPLPYVPFFNPLELVEGAILLLAAIRSIRGVPAKQTRKGWIIGITVLFFCWLNAVTGRCIHFFTGVPYSLAFLFDSPVFQAAIAALWSFLALTLTILGARRDQRTIWLTGAGLLTMVVIKLFLIDLSGTGTIGRIISFLVVGLLMLVIGFFAPLPPQTKDSSR